MKGLNLLPCGLGSSDQSVPPNNRGPSSPLRASAASTDERMSGLVADVVSAGLVTNDKVSTLRKGSNLPISKWASLEKYAMDAAYLSTALDFDITSTITIFEQIETLSVHLKMGQTSSTSFWHGTGQHNNCNRGGGESRSLAMIGQLG